MNSSRAFMVLVAICMSLQIASIGSDAKALDVAKDAAMGLATKTAENVAESTPEVEKKGGIRQTLLHTGVDLALTKGVAVLAASHPALAVAVPIATHLAKPAINKAHEKINNMMNKDESTAAPEEAATTADSSSTEAATTEAATTAASSEAPSTESAPEGGDEKTETGEGSTQKPGLMGKIKSLVKGGEEKPAADSDKNEAAAGKKDEATKQ